MLFFRKLDNAFLRGKQLLEPGAADSEEGQMLEMERMKLLRRFIVYANECSYLKHERAKVRIRTFLASKYDYAGVARKLDISRNSLEVSVNRASKLLEKKIGLALDLLLKGDVVSAEQEFLLGIGVAVPFINFLAGAASLLPQSQKSFEVDLSLSEHELRVLMLLQKSVISRIIEQCDQERLRHLLFILMGQDAVYASERRVLVQYLEGGIEHHEALKRFREVNFYR